MASGEITSEKTVFQKIFSQEFWFVIPEYQRSYIWQTDNILELVEDLKYAYENKPNNEYFLGSLVLKDLGNPDYCEYEVLDGQQRLTTFLIMMAVIRDLVDNNDYKNTLQETISQKENKLKKIPERIRITYKIRDDVDSFVKEILVYADGTKNDTLIDKYLKSTNVSLSNMANAIIQLKKSIKAIENLDEFIEFIFNKAIFIYVATSNTEDAFRMFTILNDRGIPLTNADILKSENIGVLENEAEKTKYAKLWEEIEEKHNNQFDRFLQFIRTILVKDKARANLSDEFHDRVYNSKPPKLTKGKATFALIEDYNDIYEKVIDLQSNELDNSFKNLVTIMKTGMRSDDWIPPLLYYYKKFECRNINEFLYKLEFKYTGDWVCGITPTLRLYAVNNILAAIDNAKDSIQVIEADKLYQIDEAEFKFNLNLDIYNKQYTKYLLLKLEYLLSDNSVHISNYSTLSIEHVLPQNPKPESQWVIDFTDEKRKFWTHKLANLVLLDHKKNSQLSNLDFKEKKEKYLNQKIDIFKANKLFIDSQTVWNPYILEKRQNELITLLFENNH